VDATLQQVEDALDSVPATQGVLVVQVRDDGSLKKLAQRDAAPNYPAQFIVLNDRHDAAAKFRAASQGVSGPSQADPPAEPGDTPTADEPVSGRGE
jgi:hypothetical protein